ncbi:coil containing protein [Vibrio phage 1.005.O._10N.286.48.F2]|nr:coil containing protein [Vibrio phage 1.005.O._10N.286.48.F2]
MSEVKMSDVFGVCCKSVVAESFGQYLIVNEVDTARFKNRKHTGAVAHAINNHDRLQQENAELRETLKVMRKGYSNLINLNVLPHSEWNDAAQGLIKLCDDTLSK